uniref:PlxyGVORF105 protein n=1 Tax=Plutella xylostella granulovirus TaxID=98383 RepID=A0A1B2CSK3_9BBAC|nr:PlxyGVORF105 protein [Plutella xylostella granulovirus]
MKFRSAVKLLILYFKIKLKNHLDNFKNNYILSTNQIITTFKVVAEEVIDHGAADLIYNRRTQYSIYNLDGEVLFEDVDINLANVLWEYSTTRNLFCTPLLYFAAVYDRFNLDIEKNYILHRLIDEGNLYFLNKFLQIGFFDNATLNVSELTHYHKYTLKCIYLVLSRCNFVYKYLNKLESICLYFNLDMIMFYKICYLIVRRFPDILQFSIVDELFDRYGYYVYRGDDCRVTFVVLKNRKYLNNIPFVMMKHFVNLNPDTFLYKEINSQKCKNYAKLCLYQAACQDYNFNFLKDVYKLAPKFCIAHANILLDAGYHTTIAPPKFSDRWKMRKFTLYITNIYGSRSMIAVQLRRALSTQFINCHMPDRVEAANKIRLWWLNILLEPSSSYIRKYIERYNVEWK